MQIPVKITTKHEDYKVKITAELHIRSECLLDRNLDPVSVKHAKDMLVDLLNRTLLKDVQEEITRTRNFLMCSDKLDCGEIIQQIDKIEQALPKGVLEC